MSKLSAAQYDARRQRIRDEYQTMRSRAVAWRDQQLGKLFYDSGWTTREIGDHEGRSHMWVVYRLRFGRFIAFLETIVSKPPVNLTEGKFREFWDLYGGKVTANTPPETKKFEAIIESEEWELQMADKPSIPTTDLIKEHCCDNKYRTKDEIAEAIDEPADGANRVSNAIQRIKSTHSGGLMVLDKTYAGGVVKYRFKQITNKASMKLRAVTVAEELAPIVEEFHRALNITPPYEAVEIAKAQLKMLQQLVKKYS